MSHDAEPPAFRSFGEQALHYFIRPHSAPPKTTRDSPGAWLGRDFRDQPSLWRTALSSTEIDELEAELVRIENEGIALTSLTREHVRLPAFAGQFEAWREELGQGRGFVVLSGLPVDRWSEARSSLAFWIIGHQLGQPGAQNPDNELLGHVIDYGEQTDSPHVRLYRTSADIGFHCDAADVVGLLCLQDAKSGGASRIASSIAIWNALFTEDPELALLFFESWALDRRGEEEPGQARHLDLQPACFGEDERLRIFYHGEYFRSAERLDEIGPLSPRRREALDRFDQIGASEDFRLDMQLRPGDMQFISNHTIVHARTEYEDAPERRRHLLRLWLSL